MPLYLPFGIFLGIYLMHKSPIFIFKYKNLNCRPVISQRATARPNHWKRNNASITTKGPLTICAGLGTYTTNVISELESFFADCIIHFL